MANTKILQQSFNGGIISEEMYGRVDDVKRINGVADIENFIVMPQGSLTKRQGTLFVAETGSLTSKKSRLIPFIFSLTQSFAIEIGEGYFRFYTNGAALLIDTGLVPSFNIATTYNVGDLVKSGSQVFYCIQQSVGNTLGNTDYFYQEPLTGEYEVPNNYVEADLFSINYAQSSDVMTLVHQNHPPKELRRYGAQRWILADIDIDGLPIPQNPVATVDSGSGSTTYYYVVTAVDERNSNESLPSDQCSVNNDLLITGHKNTVSWDAVVGASRYNVYLLENGIWGFIGQTANLYFIDDNIAPDVSKTPPIISSTFLLSGSNNYPSAVCYFEQRRIFAGTINNPQVVWMTRTGTESNISFSIPSKDDDAVIFKLASRENNIIRHLVPINDLVGLTAYSEWRITSFNNDAITATSISVKPQSYVGCNNIQPIIVNNSMIFSESRNSHIREMGLNQQSGSYVSSDLSLRATSLFDGYKIIDMCYVKTPVPICWFIRSDGVLLGLTYIPEQEIYAWHKHTTTNGVFESVCTVPENDEDVVYFVVKRFINGFYRRYIERMSNKKIFDRENYLYVDCAATYDGAPETRFIGYSQLEGQVVYILADGYAIKDKTISASGFTLNEEASIVTAGLPINSVVTTLPISIAIEAYGTGRTKNINKAIARIKDGVGLFFGYDAGHLTEYKQRSTEVYGSPPNLINGEIELALTGNWNKSGQIVFKQSEPLPTTIISLTLEVSIG